MLTGSWSPEKTHVFRRPDYSDWDNDLQAERDPYPWFWSDQYDCNVQMIGSVNAFDRIVRRNVEGKRAQTSIYLKSGEIVGAIGIDSGRDIRALRCVLQNGSPIRLDKIADSTMPRTGGS